MAYFTKKNLNVKIARIFNTYGPKMRPNDGRAIPNFINQALKNDYITVYGDGHQTRSFCYVDDLIKGLIRLMDSNYDKPINIGNPEDYSIKEIAYLINKTINKKNQIKYLEALEDDPKQRKPLINCAKKELDWEPEVSLTKGLKNTIEFFKSYL